MDRSFCVLKGILKISKMRFYGIVLIKIDYVYLGGFMDTVLASTSVQNILVM